MRGCMGREPTVGSDLWQMEGALTLTEEGGPLAVNVSLVSGAGPLP